MIHDRRASEFTELHSVARERARLLELTNEALRKLTLEADRRKDLIDRLTAETETLRTEIETLRGAIVERDEQISMFENAAQERLAVMLAMEASTQDRTIEDEANRRKDLIDVLTAETQTLRTEIETLRGAIIERDEQISMFENAAQERLAAMLAMEASASDLHTIEAEANRRKDLIDQLTAEIETLRGAITERDERTGSLERIAQERLEGMQAIQAAADERLEMLEVSNEAMEVLRATLALKEMEVGEREASIGELSRVAQERLDGMRQLDEALAPIRAEAEKRAVLLAEMSEVLERQDREIARLRADER